MESAIRNKYQAVIGLEVHAQLLTDSKVYCSDAVAFGAEPNTNISVVSLAHPGTLPKLNKKALEYAMKMGLACHSEISRYNIFDRKNYFYPDLPKGYQLTQDRTPICKGGYVSIKLKNGVESRVLLNRIHLEEDAGKLIHDLSDSLSMIDYNRAGTALIEIVTEPVMHSSDEAYAFMSEVRKIVRYLDICDGNMEEGSFRCDANVSVMLVGADKLGKKVEVKNMNSVRNMQRAIDFEIERQITELERGGTIVSETRTFDAASGKTFGMRAKEELNDYRYFPDPDLSPVIVSEEWLKKIAASMPPLPEELYTKFAQVYGLSEYDVQVLTETPDVAFYFEELCQKTTFYKAASNWVMGPVKAQLKELSLEASKYLVRPTVLAELIGLVEDGKVSFTVASQKLLPALMTDSTTSVLEMAQQLNVLQVNDQDTILVVIDEVIGSFPQKVQEYKNGKKGIAAMFMGEIMKRTQGKADPKKTNELLMERLKV